MSRMEITGPAIVACGAAAISSLSSRQVEDRCESYIGEDYQERGFHHRRCGRPANRVWPSTDTETFQTPDLHDDRGEGQALHQADHHIAQYDGVHNVAEVSAKSHMRAELHKDPAGQNSAGVANDCQA